MRILGLIPARGGSKGIPRKNIKMLGGKELIRYSIEQAKECALIDHVVLSTDDDAIAQVGKRAGADVPFMRPAHLASDKSPSIDTVVHALRFFEERGDEFDAVCLLQPTTPFRGKADLEGTIRKFIKLGADSLVSVRKVPHTYNPHWVYEEQANGFLKIATGDKSIISRRQDLPVAYHRDGAVYLTRKEVLLERHSLYGKQIAHYEMTASPAINIDTWADWEAAEAYLRKLNKKQEI